MRNKLHNALKSILFALSLTVCILLPSMSEAFPIFAQQAYENPREATGRIVCANCHLAQKPVEIEVPQGVLPDSVFEVVVEIPYDKSLQQVTATGAKGPLNVGSVLVLPEGFTLAPKERLTPELQEKTKGVVISPYSDSKQNILVVGHSNTTPDFANKILGSKKHIDIEDSNNSNLYIINIFGDHISDQLLYINH